MYTLILMVYISYSSSAALSVSSVPGFASVEACNAAYDAFAAEVSRKNSSSRTVGTCVKADARGTVSLPGEKK